MAATRREVEAELEQIMPLLRDALQRLSSVERRAGKKDELRAEVIDLRLQVGRLADQVELLRQSVAGLAEP